jgi:hypothetical protein
VGRKGTLRGTINNNRRMGRTPIWELEKPYRHLREIILFVGVCIKPRRPFKTATLVHSIKKRL